MKTSKRSQIVLNKSDADLSRNILFGLGIASCLAGSFLAIKNPQLTDYHRDSVIYTNGVAAESIELQPKKNFKNIGLSLACLGLASLGLAGRLNQHLSMETSTDIEEASYQTLKNLNEAIKEGVDPKKLSVDEATNIFYPVLMLIQEHIWLIDAVNAPSLVIVGGSGSGKSRLAMSIAMLSAIVKMGEINIADLDAKQNITTNCWVAGQIHGSYEPSATSNVPIEVGKEVELLLALEKAKDPTRDTLSRFQVNIFDEISKYNTGVYDRLAEMLPELIRGGSQEARKRAQQYIYIVHGLPKGMWGLEDDAPSGILDNLLSFSCVLYLVDSEPPTKVNLGQDFGTGNRAEMLFWKKSTGTLTSSSTKPSLKDPASLKGVWRKFNIPKNLDPVPLKQFLQPFINMVGLNPVLVDGLDSKVAQDRIVKETAKDLNPLAEMMYKTLLSKLTPDLQKILTTMKDQNCNYMVWLDVHQIHDRFAKDTSLEVFTQQLKRDKAVELGENNRKFRFVG